MKLTDDEQKQFDEYRAQEENGKRLRVEAVEMHEAAAQQEEAGRLMELDGLLGQGQMMLDFQKAQGVRVFRDVVASFGFDPAKPRPAEKRRKFFIEADKEGLCNTERRDPDICDALRCTSLSYIWSVVDQGKKQANKRKAKAEEVDRQEDVKLLEARVADKLEKSGEARKLNALVEQSERGEGVEAEKATSVLEKKAEKLDTTVEILKSAARTVHAVEEHSQKQKKKAEEYPIELNTMRTRLGDQYDALPREAFIEFAINYIHIAAEKSYV